MPTITKNYKFKSPDPNFERDSYNTLEELGSVTNNDIDIGHIVYCKEDKQHYEYVGIDSEEADVGGFKIFDSGGSDKYVTHNARVNCLISLPESEWNILTNDGTDFSQIDPMALYIVYEDETTTWVLGDALPIILAADSDWGLGDVLPIILN